MDETLLMILKMTAATLNYVVITALLWLVWRKKAEPASAMKILVGLVYGACSVLANHIGINYYSMILNVRDIGPLAAGLFFSPVSGILAGLIGGVERIIAGEVWNIGKFTELACGLSTMLAGFLSAALNRWAFRGRRPTAVHSFFLGAVMEVFHMYAVLFTNRDSIYMAYHIIKTAAVPMILFTAFGLMLCSWAVRKLNREPSDIGWHVKEEDVPVSIHFQRWLLAVTLALFAFNFWTSFAFQTRLVNEDAMLDLYALKMEYISEYQQYQDIEALKNRLSVQDDYMVRYYLIETDTGKDLLTEREDGATVIPEDQMEMLMEHADQTGTDAEKIVLNGVEGLYTVARLDAGHLLLMMTPTDYLYDTRDSQIYENTLSDILLFTVLYVLVACLLESLVVKNLRRVNGSLNKITNGNLDEKVWVYTSSEMKELSTDINKTVAALKEYTVQAEERMKNELKMAASIQDSALPKNFTLPTGQVELYALMKPAKGIGGDFYDFFFIDQDTLALVIADVSGKGVPAALFMMRAKTAIRNLARSGDNPAVLLENVNNVLCEENEAEMFVTVWLGLLDLKTGIMRCANAGHEYPVLMRAGGDYELMKDPHGLVLSAMEGIHLKEYEIRMEPGDRLMVYTDGVPEAINVKNEEYGTDRLVSKLNKVKIFPQKEALESVLQDIHNYAEPAEQFDDITMLGVTFVSLPAPDHG